MKSCGQVISHYEQIDLKFKKFDPDTTIDKMMEAFRRQCGVLFPDDNEPYILVDSENLCHIDSDLALKLAQTMLKDGVVLEVVLMKMGVYARDVMSKFSQKAYFESLSGEKDEEAASDKRFLKNAGFFESLLTRKEEAISEFTIIQKAVQREKMKDIIKTQQQKDLQDKFDCIQTPQMDQFDFVCSENTETILRVKRLCLHKGFTTHVKRFGDRNEHLRFECSKSPFFYENSYTPSLFKNNNGKRGQ